MIEVFNQIGRETVIDLYDSGQLEQLKQLIFSEMGRGCCMDSNDLAEWIEYYKQTEN